MKKPIPFGKYYLLERINVGGMAEVFRAKAYGVEGFERLVAVKRILPNIAEDKDFIKMFIDEAKLAVQLNHGNIAQIFDLGMVGNDYYIALEHVHGRDLRNIFERCRVANQPMPIAQACFITMKMCEGLDYAHNKRDGAGADLNLVHRDVSPQNILISFEGEAKLIDFGIAKAAGKGSQTEAGILKGKFGYMSPEQVRGLPIDRRSDVFSCGIVLYELLTGERLFVGESDFSTLEKVRNVEILPPSTYNRRISEELERIVLKALAKDVEDRYQNAIDLHDELQAFVYTAGEFFSRKDLASWMKQTFAKEIEQETAKLEAYRKISPPEAGPRPARQSAPPPVPRRRGPSTVPPPIPGRGRASSRMGAQMAGETAEDTLSTTAPGKKGLDWDDDELETAIYENEMGGPPAAAGMMNAGGDPAGSGQDLSALVQKARGWNGPGGDAEPEPPKKTPTGSNPTPNPLVRVSSNALQTVETGQVMAEAPMTLGDAPLPVGPASTIQGMPRSTSAMPTEAPPSLAQPAAGPSAFGGGVAPVPAHAPGMEMALDKRSTYQGPTVGLIDRPMDSKVGVIAAIAAGVLLLVGGIIAVVFLMGGDDNKAAQTMAAVDLENTGFELHLTPADAEIWLDDERLAKGSAKIAKLRPGDKYELLIKAPEGYLDMTKTLVPVANEIQRLDIVLSGNPVQVTFTSMPAGANVTLLGDGTSEELGATPVAKSLDPSKSYRAMFFLREGAPGIPMKVIFGRDRKPVTVNADFSQLSTMAKDAMPNDVEPAPVAVAPPPPVLPSQTPSARDSAEREAARQRRRDRERLARERAAATAAARVNATPKPKPQPKAPVVTNEVEKPPVSKPKQVAGETGTLLLGSKPPCEIYIDGRNTGMRTPKRGIKLPVGKHRITLVNNEHKIKDVFTVRIESGKRTKAVRNLMSKTE